MAGTIPHLRLQAVGTLGLSGGNEIFSMGLKFLVRPSGGGDSITPTVGDAADLATGSVPAFREFIGNDGSLAARFSQWVNLTEMRCTIIDGQGKKLPGSDTQVATVVGGQRGAAPVGGPAAGPALGEQPYQVAICVTLTGLQYSSGAASHGRFYLPGPNLGYDPSNTTYQHLTNDLMSTGATLGWANAVRTLLMALNAIAPTSGHDLALANISTSADIAGIRSQDVNFVTIDNRPDTIRRRSNSIGGQGKQQVSL